MMQQIIIRCASCDRRPRMALISALSLRSSVIAMRPETFPTGGQTVRAACSVHRER
jgi:hypothetical protein